MMPPWLRYGLFAVWVLALASTPLWAENYIVRMAIIACDVYGAGAVVEFHRRVHRLSVVLDRRVLRPRLLCRRLVAARGRAGRCWPGPSQRCSSVLFAAALGAIILRLRGHYFAIGSFGVVEVVRLVISSWGGLTGGGDGLNVPLLAGRTERGRADLPCAS